MLGNCFIFSEVECFYNNKTFFFFTSSVMLRNQVSEFAISKLKYLRLLNY